MDTRGRILTSMIVALGFCAVLLVGAPGLAQGSYPADFDPRMRYVPPQPTLEGSPPPVPRECKPRYMAGPGTGLVLGMGAMGLGGPLIWAGTYYGEPRSAGEKALIAGGSLMIAAGLAAVVYSGIKLKRNQETRNRVCRASDGSR
jgi:hypothetical protein